MNHIAMAFNGVLNLLLSFIPSGNYIFLQEKLFNSYMLNITNTLYTSLKIVISQ